MSLPRFLIIDDDATFSATLVRLLTRRGYPASAAATPAAALAAVAADAPERIVLDLNLAGQSGLSLIQPLRKRLPAAGIVVLTGYASIATAVDAIKLGATQYLAKPVELEAILSAFDDAPPATEAAVPPAQPLSVDRLTWEHIQRVLHAHGGNISATARALHMHRRTLQRKLMKKPVRQ